MKTEYVRIYSEKELHRRVQQTSVMLKDMKQKIAADTSFCDIDALTKMWLQYEFTRFVVSESLYSEDEEYAYEPCLFVEREVENDYSDDLTDPSALHNGIVSMQFLFDSIQKQLSQRGGIISSQYMPMRTLVLDLATDICMHLNIFDAGEHKEFQNLLDHLNYTYLYNTEEEEVFIEDVIPIIIDNMNKL